MATTASARGTSARHSNRWSSTRSGAGCSRFEHSSRGVRSLTFRAGRRLLGLAPSRAESFVKLATLKDGGRDGTLVVVSRDLRRAVKVPDIARTRQYALENWHRIEGDLRRGGKGPHEKEVDPKGARRGVAP